MIVWKANLNNGETIVGQFFNDSWKKLKQKIDQQDLSIIGLRVQGEKGQTYEIPDGVDGYFFSRKLRAHFIGKTGEEGFGAIGYLEGDKVNVVWFDAQMNIEDQEVREKKDCLASLIVN